MPQTARRLREFDGRACARRIGGGGCRRPPPIDTRGGKERGDVEEFRLSSRAETTESLACAQHGLPGDSGDGRELGWRDRAEESARAAQDASGDTPACLVCRGCAAAAVGGAAAATRPAGATSAGATFGFLVDAQVALQATEHER